MLTEALAAKRRRAIRRALLMLKDGTTATRAELFPVEETGGTISASSQFARRVLAYLVHLGMVESTRVNGANLYAPTGRRVFHVNDDDFDALINSCLIEGGRGTASFGSPSIPGDPFTPEEEESEDQPDQAGMNSDVADLAGNPDWNQQDQDRPRDGDGDPIVRRNGAVVPPALSAPALSPPTTRFGVPQAPQPSNEPTPQEAMLAALVRVVPPLVDAVERIERRLVAMEKRTAPFPTTPTVDIAEGSAKMVLESIAGAVSKIDAVEKNLFYMEKRLDGPKGVSSSQELVDTIVKALKEQHDDASVNVILNVIENFRQTSTESIEKISRRVLSVEDLLRKPKWYETMERTLTVAVHGALTPYDTVLNDIKNLCGRIADKEIPTEKLDALTSQIGAVTETIESLKKKPDASQAEVLERLQMVYGYCVEILKQGKALAPEGADTGKNSTLMSTLNSLSTKIGALEKGTLSLLNASSTYLESLRKIQKDVDTIIGRDSASVISAIDRLAASKTPVFVKKDKEGPYLTTDPTADLGSGDKLVEAKAGKKGAKS